MNDFKDHPLYHLAFSIAMVCHEANRAFCLTIADNLVKPWDETDEYKRIIGVAQVLYILDHPKSTIEEQHAYWAKCKIAQGWEFGTEKDCDKKTDPSLTQFSLLSEFGKGQVKLFRAIVTTLNAVNNEIYPASFERGESNSIKEQARKHYLSMIDGYREGIDSFINSVGDLMPSREVSLFYTNLQRSFMWLGQAKGALGEATPYPKSEDHKSPVIENQAQHTTNFVDFSNIDFNQTARVKHFRALCQEMINDIENLRTAPIPVHEPTLDIFNYLFE